ncbi:uncharacterized protein [Apostichopus japonicus]|uniref:uncharacterized protein n=1 Tax=Stichopus japonicus TaxID=307972 RepID=UPI003AB51520
MILHANSKDTLRGTCWNREVLIWHCLYFMHMDINFIGRNSLIADESKLLEEYWCNGLQSYGSSLNKKKILELTKQTSLSARRIKNWIDNTKTKQVRRKFGSRSKAPSLNQGKRVPIAASWQSIFQNMVTTGAVQLMSADQLDRLGVEGIGRQAILRSRCRASALNVEGDNRERAAQRETSRLFRPYSVPAPNQRRKRLLSLTVMCLALPSTKIIPSKFQQKILQAAGLGEKKISVSSSKTAVELQARLMEEFPKLKDAGGYEYLRSTAQTKLLESISLPAGGGYSAANLKFVMKQARIYLRPIQAELDLSNMTVDEVTEEDELMIECNQCQMFFAQTKLKKHVTQQGRWKHF